MSQKRGIRFQISILLLLSTLNSIGLAAVSILLFSAVTQDREDPQTRSALGARIAAFHATLFSRSATTTSPNFDVLNQLESELGGRPEVPAKIRKSLLRYREAVNAFVRSDRMPSLQNPSFAAVEDAQRLVLEQIYSAPDFAQPSWVKDAVPLFPWALAWVVALTLVTLVEVFRLQQNFSKPLSRLALAAREVAAGHVSSEMPIVQADNEVKEVTESVEVMRRKLVEAISVRDTKNEEIAAVFRSLREGVLSVDDRGVILDSNDEAKNLLRDLPNATPPSSGVHISKSLPTFPEGWLAEGRETQREIKTQGPEGRHLLVRAAPLRGGSGFVIVIRDVTIEREIEKMKQEFLSVVTHELKTPLTSIDGYAKLLLRGKGGPLNERQHEFVKTIADQSEALKAHIQDLLDLTRLEAGRLPLSIEALGVPQLLEKAKDAHHAQAEAKGLVITTDVSKLQATRVRGDSMRLLQVLGNLIVNAIKFTQTGSIHLDGETIGDRVVLRVKDTGRGIPPESLDRIFDKFYQVEQGDTRVAGGAGLGLSICRQLIEAHEGTIAVRSTVGQGSTFEITLPKSELEVRPDQENEE